MVGRSRNVHFRSNQLVREHVVNFSDTSLHTLALKRQRKKRKKGKPVHTKIGNEIMKQTAKQNVSDFQKRAQRRARLLRKQRIVFLFTRIQNRAVERIQKKVKEFLSWRDQVRKEEAATFLAKFYRRLKTRRMWRELANGAGMMKQRVVDGLCRVIQRRTRQYLWKRTRILALQPIQRAVHSYLTRKRTARKVQQRVARMATRLARWFRRRQAEKRAARRKAKEAAEREKQRRRAAARTEEEAKQKRITKRLARQTISKITYARKQFLLETRAHYNMANWLHSRGLTTRLEKHPELVYSDESDGEGGDDDQNNIHGTATTKRFEDASSARVPGLTRNPRTSQSAHTRSRSRNRPSRAAPDRNLSSRTRPHLAHSRGGRRAELLPGVVTASDLQRSATVSTDEATQSSGRDEAFVPEGVEDWVDFFMTNEHWSVEKNKIRGMELSFTMLDEARQKRLQAKPPGNNNSGSGGGASGAGKGLSVSAATSGRLFSSVKLSDVWGLFRDMDVDRDGQVTREEFKNAMDKLGEDFTMAEVDKVFAYVDSNDSGSISIAELQAAMAVYQRKYSSVVQRRRKFGKAQKVMNQIYAKRLGGHVRDELDEAIEQGSSLAARMAKMELDQLRNQAKQKAQVLNKKKTKKRRPKKPRPQPSERRELTRGPI